MQRGADHVEPLVLGLVAVDQADPRVLHVPNRMQHPHPVGQPAGSCVEAMKQFFALRVACKWPVKDVPIGLKTTWAACPVSATNLSANGQ